MARFMALLLIGPWLIVLGWLYWLYVRKRAANGVSAGFDVGVLIASAVARRSPARRPATKPHSATVARSGSKSPRRSALTWVSTS